MLLLAPLIPLFPPFYGKIAAFIFLTIWGILLIFSNVRGGSKKGVLFGVAVLLMLIAYQFSHLFSRFWEVGVLFLLAGGVFLGVSRVVSRKK